LTSGATTNLEAQASTLEANTNFDINSFQNTQTNANGGVSLDTFQTKNTTETTFPTGLDAQFNTTVNTNDFQKDLNILSTTPAKIFPSLDLNAVSTTNTLDAATFQTSTPVESAPTLDLNIYKQLLALIFLLVHKDLISMHYKLLQLIKIQVQLSKHQAHLI